MFSSYVESFWKIFYPAPTNNSPTITTEPQTVPPKPSTEPELVLISPAHAPSQIEVPDTKTTLFTANSAPAEKPLDIPSSEPLVTINLDREKLVKLHDDLQAVTQSYKEIKLTLEQKSPGKNTKPAASIDSLKPPTFNIKSDIRVTISLLQDKLAMFGYNLGYSDMDNIELCQEAEELAESVRYLLDIAREADTDILKYLEELTAEQQYNLNILMNKRQITLPDATNSIERYIGSLIAILRSIEEEIRQKRTVEKTPTPPLDFRTSPSPFLFFVSGDKTPPFDLKSPPATIIAASPPVSTEVPAPSYPAAELSATPIAQPKPKKLSISEVKKSRTNSCDLAIPVNFFQEPAGYFASAAQTVSRKPLWSKVVGRRRRAPTATAEPTESMRKHPLRRH
jgi:hypothetical protein